MVKAATKSGRPRGLKRSMVPKRWRRIVEDIPCYDPYRDAEGCWFDGEAAAYYIDFIETCCTHIEGKDLAGQPFILEQWEKAIVANLFGWYKHDFKERVVRRYRQCLVYIPRKNGKTPLAAAIHNAVFFLDDEPGQINNLAAASRDQATKLYRHIDGMIENEEEMRDRCQRFATTRSITKGDHSVTKVIPADDKVAHGDNPHFQVMDELHSQPDRRLYTALISGMSSANRLQPLLFLITTADYDQPSLCNDEYDYACKVRDGVVPDPTYLPVIYEAMHEDSEGRIVEDKWDSAATWYKANPNLGVSKSIDYMHEAVLRAREDPQLLAEFKRLDLNIRVQVGSKIISLSKWDACGGDIDWSAFDGEPCWAALDIGATSDFVSFVLLFSKESGDSVEVRYEDQHGAEKTWKFVRRDYWLRHFCWLPEIPRLRDPRMAEQIEVWKRGGFIRSTPGDCVDYDMVGGEIVRLLEPYTLRQLAIDQGFQGMQISQDMQNMFGDETVVRFHQALLSMAAPFREFVELIKGGRLHHDGDPVLRWMAGNVVAVTRGGLVKPDKERSPEKIDGVTASTMAVGIAMVSEPAQESIYETRGIWKG